MTQILLIDDDPPFYNLLAGFLEDSGFEVLYAQSGQAGLKLLYDHRPDLILLDLVMPDMDGWETCRRVRQLTDVPIIFLTAKEDEPARLECFRLGADDFVSKPPSFTELTARIEAVLRRTSQPVRGLPSEGNLVCGPFRLDRARRLVIREGHPIRLTPTEYRLLEKLMSQPGVVFSQEQLLKAVWGPQYADAAGYVRNYVWHLRKKIEPDPNDPQYLISERGFGYRFMS